MVQAKPPPPIGIPRSFLAGIQVPAPAAGFALRGIGTGLIFGLWFCFLIPLAAPHLRWNDKDQ